MLRIGRYTIKKDDDLNFGLYETKQKGMFRGKQAEGTKEELIGYYGYLDMAMSKIINLELLRGLNNSEDSLVAQDILELITTVKTELNEAYHIGAKEWKK